MTSTAMQGPDDQQALSLRGAIELALKLADEQDNSLIAAYLADALDLVERTTEQT